MGIPQDSSNTSCGVSDPRPLAQSLHYKQSHPKLELSSLVGPALENSVMEQNAAPIKFSLPLSEVFFSNEVLENSFISLFTLIIISLINIVIVSMLRHRGEKNQLRVGNYFDMVAYNEIFNLTTWIKWLKLRPEVSISKATNTSTEPSQQVARRRLCKAILLHGLAAALQLALLYFFSQEVTPLKSDNVGVVVKYAHDGLTRIRIGNCLISTPEKRREQLGGVFSSCVSVTPTNQEPLSGNVDYEFVRGGSTLLLKYTAAGATITSKIQFRHIFENVLTAKLDDNVNEVFMQAFLDGAAAKNCTLSDQNIPSLSGCSNLDVVELGLAAAEATGFVGGDSTLGVVQNLEEQAFVEKRGVIVGSFSSTKLKIMYLPIIAGVILLVCLLMSAFLDGDPQAIVNLLIIEKAKKPTSWPYLFVDGGRISAVNWLDENGEGHIGTSLPEDMEEVQGKFEEGVALAELPMADISKNKGQSRKCWP